MLDKGFFRRCIGLPSRPLVRSFLAEFASTFVLVLCINGSKAQAVLTKGQLAGFLADNIADGVGVMSGVLIAGGITGGHMNPAMTFAQACIGKIEWKKVPIYWLAQYIGSFAAAACVYAVYLEAINSFTGGEYAMTNDDPGLAVIFATYPAPYLTVLGAIVDQLAGSALLLICASALTDQRNCQISIYLIAFYMGMIIMGLGFSFSCNCGAPLNPARDFSPRLLSCLVGWGTTVFSYHDWMWFWIPLVIPHVGAALGAFVYVIFIEAHWPV